MALTRRAAIGGLSSLAAAALARPANSQAMLTCRVVGAAPAPRPDQGYMFLGAREGFFKALGVTLEYSTVNGAALATQLVATGQAQLAVNAVLDFVTLKQQQPQLPVHMVYLEGPANGYQLAVLPESPFKSFKDLKGRTIGIVSFASGGELITKALLRHAGVDASTVNFAAVGMGNQALTALKTKQVDALSQYRGQLAVIENLGVTLRYLPDAPLLGGCFLANDKSIKSERETLVRALQCIVLNQIFMELNPEAAVHSFYAIYGTPKGDVDAATRADVHLIKRNADTFLSMPMRKKWGVLTSADLHDQLSYLGEDSDLSSKRIELGSVYTNELVSDVNRVDTNLAVQAAKTLR